jgi:hypothetical protein
VIWFSGAEYTTPAGLGVAGPGAAGEGALTTYLGGGGCLILSSQDYLWDHGLTAFGASVLGIGSYTNDVAQTTVTGQGPVFGGLGPYTLLYPFDNFSDEVVPAAPGDLAFVGDVGDVAVAHADGGSRTMFLGFPWETIQAPQDREAVLQAALAWCAEIHRDGFESGDTSAWSLTVP